MEDKKNFIQQFRNLYDDRKNDLEDIILEKYVYGPKILEKQFKEYVGHTPFQALVGAIVGAIVAFVMIFCVYKL